MANPLIVNPYTKRKYTQAELDTIPDLRPALGEVGKGIRAFADETQATGYGVLALGAQQLKDVFNAKEGGFLDRTVQAGFEGYTRNIREATAGRQAPNIARVEDIKDFSSGFDWAAYNLAKGLPQLGMLAVGGGVGAGVAKLTVKKKLKDIMKAKISDTVTKEMKDLAKVEIKKRIGRGAMTGGFAGAFGLEGGHAMGQALEAGVDPSRAADAATIIGGINGALEFLPFYVVAKKLGRGDFAKKSIRNIIKNDAELSKRAIALAVAKETGKRAGSAGLVGAGAEGITEGLQELVNIAGLRWAEQEPMFADLDSEDWSQVKNAMAAGTLIGGFAGGGVGPFKGPGQAVQVSDEVIPPGVVVPPATATPPIEPGTEARFKDITGQLRIGEQKKLEETIEVRDPRTNTSRILEKPWIESLEGSFVLLSDQDAEIPFTITDVKGDLIVEGLTKEEALEGLKNYKKQQLQAEDILSELAADFEKGIVKLKDGFTAEQLPNGEIGVSYPSGEAWGVYNNLKEFHAKWINEENLAQTRDLENGFTLEQQIPESEVKVYDPDGELYETYSDIDDFESKWDASKAINEIETEFEEIDYADTPLPTRSLTDEINEFLDPAIAAKIKTIEQLVEDGHLTKETAANQMAGLVGQLTSNPVVAPITPAVKTSEMTKTGKQEGSNKGAWFTDKQGNDLYVKEGQTLDHTISEYIARQLYTLAGIDTPITIIMEGDSEGFAGPVIGSQKVTAGADALKDGFVVDAWLGNWDVIGLENDNYLGTPEAGIRIDFGGALHYRAQGGKKGDAETQIFGAEVGELQSLRDPSINPQAAEVFKNVTNEDIIKQAGVLARLDNEEIYDIVTTSYGEQNADLAQALVDTLLDRKQDILKYAEALKQQGPKAETAGTAESLQHWVKDVDKNAPLTEKLKYAMQDPHAGVWAEIAAEDSRYGILLINPDNGKVLLRKPKDDYDGYAWTFAKGKTANQEHPTVTAARELQEETGYKTDIVGQIYKPFYSGTSTGALFYVGVVKGEQVEFGTETSEVKWATYDEALTLVKEGTNKQGVARDTKILQNLFGTAKPDIISEYPVKQGAAHAKSYFQSGQFAEDAPWTPWKSKNWHVLTPLRQLYVKSAAFLKQVNKKNKDYLVSEADINKEVSRMQKAFKKWSGFSFTQINTNLPKPASEQEMLENFPLKTGQPFVTKTYHGNSSGEIIGDRLNPAKHAGSGAGGLDTKTLSDKKGVFYMANNVAGAKAWAGGNINKVFAFYFAAKNPKVVWYNKGWGSNTFIKRIKEADEAGYDSIVFVNVKDSGGKYHQLIAFDAQQQVRTTMLENIGYSPSPTAKMFESQGAKDATTNLKEKFNYDFTNVFGAGILQQATENGLLTINETSPEGSPAGVFNKETNQITINLDRVAEGETPMSVLLHEGRHAGMQDILGETLPLFHQDLLDLANRGNKDAQSSIIRSTAAVADSLNLEHTLYDLGQPQSELEAEVKAIRKLIEEKEQGAELLQEEDLAYYIQDAANATDLTAPGLYRRLINALKVWWAQSGVGQMFAQAGLRAELTQEMAVELAKAAVRKATQEQRIIQGEGVLASDLQSLESIPNPVGILKRWWGESKDTPLDANNVDLMGKFRAHIIDNLATIDEKSTDVHKVAEVAKSKTSAEQSKINRLFLDPLVALAKATGLNQKQLDEWLLARHILLDDENWQNTQKRSWMVARDLAIALPQNLRTELDKRRVSLTKDQIWIDKEGKTHKIPKTKVLDRMVDLVNEYFQEMEKLSQDGTLGEQFTAWKELKESWIKIQAHSAGLYSPGKVDANGQLLPGQPKRANVSNAPDAYDIFHSYSEDKIQYEALQAMAKKWDEMTGYQLDLLIEGGKITDEEAIAMRNAHPHYVKSRRSSSENDKSFEFLETGGAGGGKPKVRAGTIEYDPVVHVMQNTIAQAHSNAAAAQQNQAALYLYREVIGDEKHWEGWFTKEKEEIHHLDTFGFLHDRPTSRPEAFDIPVTIMADDGKSGKTVYLRPVPQNQKAKLFAAGMNKLGVQNQGAVAKVLGLGNKIVRNMAVTFSPAFLAANIFRDPATALYNLQATEGKDHTRDFLIGSGGSGRTGLGNAWKILNSVYTNRDKADPQHIKWVEEWEHAGGRQSFTQALKEMDEGWKSFESSLAIARKPGISHAYKGLEWIEKYNIIVENISRFSAYSTVMEAWERGEISKWDTKEKAQREAAIISKELTTNFDRKGFSSQAIGLWHLFFNATVQGNVQVIRNLIKSKKLQKMVAGSVITATMFDLLGRMSADEDDEGRNEWDNIPDYIKERNIILPFKIGGVYIKIPAPWVYNSVWRAGGMIGELAANKRDVASVPIDMGLSLMNTFNPMASASLMQSLSPTILDPFVQAVENQNFAGNPIKPTSFPGAAALPESQLYWSSTPRAYVGLAQTLNALSGGDVAKSGFIDISPGVIHNYVNFFTAGVGKAIGQVYDLGEAVVLSDKEFEIKDVPILSTYAITPGSQVDVQLYHDRVAQILQAQKAVDLYGKGKTRDVEKQRESRIKYAKELRLVNHVKDVERQLRSIRTRMRAAQGRKDSKRVKQLKAKLTAVQQKFNKTYERRMR